ncbi:hypothetical protein [Kitasatospora sp. McL0602]|uniref:hypothetical protein n=1 Tax=Kitasatospora sp. McL0602 TaxID=3439530 RepID=UPI003F8A4B82
MTITRATIIQRARTWVDIGLKYNQAGSHAGYRTDCSGYVSMCWQLDRSDDTTGFVPSGEAVFITKAALRAGDALLNDAPGNDGHIALFESWDDSSQDSYTGYEFSGSGVHHRSIPYPYFSGHGTFLPVRGTKTVDSPEGGPVPPPPNRRKLEEEVV